MTLTAYNPELSNVDFEIKKKIYEQSNFYYTRALNKYPEWTSKQIQKRAKNLAEAATKIWTLPEEFNSRFAKLGDSLSTSDSLKTVKVIAENFDRLSGTNFREEIYCTLRR